MAESNIEYFRPSDAKRGVAVSRSMNYKWAKPGHLTLTKVGNMTFVSMTEYQATLKRLGG